MAAISLFWYTNMPAVTSDENDLYQNKIKGFPDGFPVQNSVIHERGMLRDFRKA
jgi:hypothetical protein